MWETTDPDGRRIVLTRGAWRHACRRHPQIIGLRDALLARLPSADECIPGREPGEVWLYVRGLGPSRLVKVVVHYDGPVGWIWTAFPRGRFP